MGLLSFALKGQHVTKHCNVTLVLRWNAPASFIMLICNSPMQLAGRFLHYCMSSMLQMADPMCIYVQVYS